MRNDKVRMGGAHRRRWKLHAMKGLAGHAGLGLSSIRRTVGSRNFSELVDEAFASASFDPARGAKIIRAMLYEKYGTLLEHPMAPYERK